MLFKLNLDINTTIIIAIYGAVVSTGMLFWRMWERYRDKSPRAKVKITIQTWMPLSGTINDDYTTLSVKITNIGSENLLISTPHLEFTNVPKGKKYASLVRLKSSEQFPLKIEPKHIFTDHYESLVLKDSLIRRNIPESSSFRVVITDTLDNNFKSNWMSLKELYRLTY